MSAIMKCLYNICIYFYKGCCREKLTITCKKVLHAFHPILIPKARFFEDPKILHNTSILYCKNIKKYCYSSNLAKCRKVESCTYIVCPLQSQVFDVKIQFEKLSN